MAYSLLLSSFTTLALVISDFKLIANEEDVLTEQIRLVSNLIMIFRLNLDWISAQKQRLNIELKNNITIIEALEQHEIYKYLGIEERDGVQQKNMKTRPKNEYYRRIRVVLKSELKQRTKFSPLYHWQCLVVQYSFGLIKYIQAEIRKLDHQTRKRLTLYGALHPKSGEKEGEE